MAKTHKLQGNITLFDWENKYRALSKMVNPLERLSNVMDFGPELEQLISKSLKSSAGASVYDPMLMFKGLVI
jgi:hypothetical protein